MATTTCTRFTDEYQLYEELGKWVWLAWTCWAAWCENVSPCERVTQILTGLEQSWTTLQASSQQRVVRVCPCARGCDCMCAHVCLCFFGMTVLKIRCSLSLSLFLSVSQRLSNRCLLFSRILPRVFPYLHSNCQPVEKYSQPLQLCDVHSFALKFKVNVGCQKCLVVQRLQTADQNNSSAVYQKFFLLSIHLIEKNSSIFRCGE